MSGKPSLVTLSCLVLILAGGSAGGDEIRFNRDVRPILADRCFGCHGPDAASNESGLRLDQAEAAVATPDSDEEAAFIPGDPENSVALQRIRETDPDLKMPPASSHLAISPEELEILEEWVRQGARYEPHWSFRPLEALAPLPEPADQTTVPLPGSRIDFWVRKELERRGLHPAPESEPWRWLRRVSLDLTGLPPEPEELAALEQDPSPEHRARIVDRLLASPHFGEHMAVPWMDAARYADSYGYQSDLLSPTWPWRDWLVSSFNRNLPYDQFLTQQLAGDLLPNADRDSILATAFNRLHRQTNEGGSVEEEWRQEYVADRVNTFGSAILGLTLECARCHDHKFDPLSQREYYALSAFFNNIDEYGTYDSSDRVPTPNLALPDPAQAARIAAAEAEVARLKEEWNRLQAELAGAPFETWRAGLGKPVELPKPVGDWPLDEIVDGGKLANRAKPENPGTAGNDNRLVPGKSGQALLFSGDSPAEFNGLGARLDPWQRFSVEGWLQVPAGLGDCVILHRQSGTDTGHFGTELRVVNNRLRFSMIRFWPGQALSIETTAEVPRDRWFHFVVSHQGNGSAGGMQILVDGISRTRVVHDQLYKAPGAGGGDGFAVGERFRSVGLKGGMLDQLRFFDRPLVSWEANLLMQGEVSVGDLASASLEQQREWFLARSEAAEQLARQLAEAVRRMFDERAGVFETMVMREATGTRPTWVLARGDYNSPRSDDNLVQRDVPECLNDWPAGAPRDRLGLAQWLVADQHPLTARVAVNRVWQNFFGQGLVATPGDFGLQGNYPSHPELLDGLAAEFVARGWDLKWLCREIVLSATYRQTSVVSPEQRNADPGNVWLSRGPARRLSAEMVRDLALAASGLLVRDLGGPPVSPYQPGDLWRENNSMTQAWQQGHGRDLYRRSLYSVWKRTAPLANMTVFDAPSREVCTVSRGPTSTPLQALVLLNDIQFVEAARKTAERALRTDGPETADQIGGCFRRLAGRPPDPREQEILQNLFREQLQQFQTVPEDAAKLLRIGESTAEPFPDGSAPDPATHAALTIVVQAILNSDAVVWKR